MATAFVAGWCCGGAAKDCGGGPKAEGAKAEPKPEAGPLKLAAVAAIRR